MGAVTGSAPQLDAVTDAPGSFKTDELNASDASASSSADRKGKDKAPSSSSNSSLAPSWSSDTELAGSTYKSRLPKTEQSGTVTIKYEHNEVAKQNIVNPPALAMPQADWGMWASDLREKRPVTVHMGLEMVDDLVDDLRGVIDHLSVAKSDPSARWTHWDEKILKHLPHLPGLPEGNRVNKDSYQKHVGERVPPEHWENGRSPRDYAGRVNPYPKLEQVERNLRLVDSQLAEAEGSYEEIKTRTTQNFDPQGMEKLPGLKGKIKDLETQKKALGTEVSRLQGETQRTKEAHDGRTQVNKEAEEYADNTGKFLKTDTTEDSRNVRAIRGRLKFYLDKAEILQGRLQECKDPNGKLSTKEWLENFEAFVALKSQYDAEIETHHVASRAKDRYFRNYYEGRLDKKPPTGNSEMGVGTFSKLVVPAQDQIDAFNMMSKKPYSGTPEEWPLDQALFYEGQAASQPPRFTRPMDANLDIAAIVQRRALRKTFNYSPQDAMTGKGISFLPRHTLGKLPGFKWNETVRNRNSAADDPAKQKALDALKKLEQACTTPLMNVNQYLSITNAWVTPHINTAQSMAATRAAAAEQARNREISGLGAFTSAIKNPV